MIAERRTRFVALALILLIALGWRLNNIAFGLPSMWDPDEPIFMIIPLRMLTEGTLDPGWFGHPGSTVIYLVALIDAAVAGLGIASGRYADAATFAHAAFENPAMLFVPARVAMALIGTGTVWLTYLIGKRVQGTATGLVAALLLAINGLHIAWSQVIRTDIPASLFMLAFHPCERARAVEGLSVGGRLRRTGDGDEMARGYGRPRDRRRCREPGLHTPRREQSGCGRRGLPRGDVRRVALHLHRLADGARQCAG